jgi:hypothetical protein
VKVEAGHFEEQLVWAQQLLIARSAALQRQMIDNDRCQIESETFVFWGLMPIENRIFPRSFDITHVSVTASIQQISRIRENANIPDARSHHEDARMTRFPLTAVIERKNKCQ